MEHQNSDMALTIVRLMNRIEALEKSNADIDKRLREETSDNLIRRALPLPKGDKGEPGERGPTGPRPDHKWQGTKLSFQKPNGQFGEAVDLKGEPGAKGKATTVVGGGSKFPAGGATGQVLAKASAADQDVEWVNQTGGSAALTGVSLLPVEYVFPTSDPQIEQAAKSISAKINEIIEALS